MVRNSGLNECSYPDCLPFSGTRSSLDCSSSKPLLCSCSRARPVSTSSAGLQPSPATSLPKPAQPQASSLTLRPSASTGSSSMSWYVWVPRGPRPALGRPLTRHRTTSGRHHFLHCFRANDVLLGCDAVGHRQVVSRIRLLGLATRH